MTVEKVSQEEMHSQFKERYAKLIEENQQLSAKIKEVLDNKKESKTV